MSLGSGAWVTTDAMIRKTVAFLAKGGISRWDNLAEKNRSPDKYQTQKTTSVLERSLAHI